jgi:hypothetical protein
MERFCHLAPWPLWKEIISDGKIRLCKTLLVGNY